MEIALLLAPPLLFLALAAAMIVVSQVSGWLTFMRYSRRQQASNRAIYGYVAQLHGAKNVLSRRAAQLHRLSASLAKTNSELENLNLLKTRFMSMAAHDMRTPIATIRGCAELLSDRPLIAKDKKNVQSILASAENVGRLMSDLTDLSIIEAGKLRVALAPLDAGSLVADVFAVHGPAASAKGVELVSTPAPAVTLYADRFRLGQVLANLVGNALKFTPAGGRVRVSVAAGGGGALFSVTDTGPGIHASEVKRVFEKFYQSKFSDPNAARKGWGLGLSIAAEIVRAHAGEIGVESPGLGKGARFWFFVPSRPPAKGKAKVPKSLFAVALLALLSFINTALPAAAQQPTMASPSSVIPIDDKARYDKFLEEKADSVLLRMLGPNRAKVLVDATLDFTRVERFEVTTGAKAEGEAGAENVLFAWQKATATKGGQPKEFLPGIPMDVEADPEAARAPQSYERQYSFPTSFVKKLVVTIIIDKKITPEEAETIEKVVQNLLDVDPARGDVLTVIRATFAPAWKTIWYSTDSVSMLFKYGLIAFLALVTLVVVAWCFVKLAGAIEAMAKAQTQQYAMDVGMKPQLEDQSQGLPELEGPKEEEKDAEEEPAADETDIVIEVKPHQIDTLVEMLRGEDAENIALVCAYLAPDVRKKFMGALPSDKQAEVVMNMSSVRFVEEEMVAKIKSEIEQRLAGAVGGMGRIYDFIETAPPNLQRQLLAEIEGRDPELHKRLRKKVLMMEDLLALSSEEWSVLMGRTRIDVWATALPGSPEGLSKCVEAQVLPQTWMIVSQIMESSGSTPEKVMTAQMEILDEARRLITEGKIHNPVGERPEAPAVQPAAA